MFIKKGLKMVEKKYNTFWRRLVARCIDGFIIGFIFSIINLVSILINLQLTSLLSNMAYFTYLIYNFWFHYRYGQTIGKRIMEIKVLNLSGSQINFWQAIIRETLVFTMLSVHQVYKYFQLTRSDLIMVGVFNITLLLIDLSIVVINNKKRTLHDLITKTVVVRID
jgi:uncharacterized RDD family membrane protein YckC